MATDTASIKPSSTNLSPINQQHCSPRLAPRRACDAWSRTNGAWRRAGKGGEHCLMESFRRSSLKNTNTSVLARKHGKVAPIQPKIEVKLEANKNAEKLVMVVPPFRVPMSRGKTHREGFHLKKAMHINLSLATDPAPPPQPTLHELMAMQQVFNMALDKVAMA